MSGAAHTPGPWQWDGDHVLRPATPDPRSSATHTILSPDGPCGFLGSDYRDSVAEFTCNKALIAAAPELLAALQAAVDVYGQPGGPWNVPGSAGSWIAQARDAIATATGGES